MSGAAQRATRRGAGSAWTWWRLLSVALCLALLVSTVRPHVSEARTDATGVAIMTACDLPGTTDDGDGSLAPHCVHCGCGVLANDVRPSQASPAPGKALLDASGPRGRPEAVSFLDPRPPRS